MPGSLPALATPQSPSVAYISVACWRLIVIREESTPNWKRPSSKSNSPSIRPCLISVSWVWALMRSTWDPNCSGGKSGFRVPPVPATAAAASGYQVRAPSGRPLLKRSSCAQLPPQYGPTVQLLVPARLK